MHDRGAAPDAASRLPPWALYTAAALAVAFVLAWRLPAATHVGVEIPGYLPVHTLLETLAVAVALLVAAVGWSAYFHGERHRRGIAVLATGFLGVALLDAGHFMSYAGMPEFVTPSSPEKAIDFWLAARFAAGAALLAAVLAPPRASGDALPRVLLGISLLFTAAVYAVILLRAEVLPRTFVPGLGLTPLKIGAEYLLVAMYLGCAGVLAWRGPRDTSIASPQLFLAAFVMGLSELAFTMYTSVSDLFNGLGHLYKIVAYWFLYRAVFVMAVEAPYVALRRSREALSVERERERVTLQSVADALVTTDDEGRITRLNRAAERLTGWATDEAVGRTVAEVLALRRTSDGSPVPDMAAEAFFLGAAVGPRDDLWLRSRSGRRSEVAVSVSPIIDARGAKLGTVLTMQDITERRANESRIERLAYFDPLTELPNRRLLLDRLEHAIAAGRRGGWIGALLFLDLDQFKTLNDALGHEAGDQLLRGVAARLSHIVRGEDTVARLGGDEFVLVLTELSTTTESAAMSVTHVARRIGNELAQPFVIGGHEHVVHVSIGATLFPGDADEGIADLLKQADAAMFRAKEAGRNTVRFYEPSMQALAQQRLQLEQDLLAAIERQEFLLEYQPQVDPQGRIVGAEALLRWQHPRRGRVPPGEFIAAAEQSGSIVAIGQWVLEQAVALLGRLRRHEPHLHIAVNVSPRQFRLPDFAERIAALLAAFDADPNSLILEVTEGVLLDAADDNIARMKRLTAMGVRFSLDDFGTGYSSLSYLKRLPVAEIKIDRGFVGDALADPHDASLIGMIVAVGQQLGLRVVAEGVETAAQRDFLLATGCTLFQGYHFHRPMPEAALLSLLSASETRPSPSLAAETEALLPAPQGDER